MPPSALAIAAPIILPLAILIAACNMVDKEGFPWGERHFGPPKVAIRPLRLPRHAIHIDQLPTRRHELMRQQHAHDRSTYINSDLPRVRAAHGLVPVQVQKGHDRQLSRLEAVFSSRSTSVLPTQLDATRAGKHVVSKQVFKVLGIIEV